MFIRAQHKRTSTNARNIMLVFTNEECNSTVHMSGRNFLYNSKGLDVISLLVKYYVPLAHINKDIKLLKFKSVINLQYVVWEAQSNGRRNRESAIK